MGRLKLDPETKYRVCRVCRVTKSIHDFYSHRGQPLGKSYMCKECDKAQWALRSYKGKGREALEKEIAHAQELITLKQLAILELNMEDRDGEK